MTRVKAGPVILTLDGHDVTAFEMTIGNVIPTTTPLCHFDDRREEKSLRPFPAAQNRPTEHRCPITPRFLTTFEMTIGNVALYAPQLQNDKRMAMELFFVLKQFETIPFRQNQ